MGEEGSREEWGGRKQGRMRIRSDEGRRGYEGRSGDEGSRGMKGEGVDKEGKGSRVGLSGWGLRAQGIMKGAGFDEGSRLC